MTQEPVVNVKQGGKREHGRLYWLLRNTLSGVFCFYKRHWLGASIWMIFALFTLFATRAMTHPYWMVIRRKSFLLALVFFLLVVVVWARKRHPLVKLLAFLACAGMMAALYMWGGPAHDYATLYRRYRSLEKVELSKLPVTSHERIQPLNSIYSLAHEKAATEMETPQQPDWVRDGDEYRWTAAIEPAHPYSRLFGKVTEVLSLRDDSPVPYFEKRFRNQVNFEVGESMLLGKNSLSATVKAFGLWRYINYEPADVSYFRDDSGELVQVVTLVRWTGLFFPWPEFGGVQLIRQQKATLAEEIKLMLLGTGEWIRPEDVWKHKFLVGQNILSYEVSRYIADSWRFQKGFWGPMPGNQQGDVRIPNLPADQNDQPFTAHFEEVQKRKGLFHYFALEPADPAKQGLAVSLFIPADGSGPVYSYNHADKGESLTGVSAIASRVMDTKREYNWSRHRPVEHRPFIRDIDGKQRFLWLTTVVTFKEGTTGRPENVVSSEKKEEAVVSTGEQRWFIAGSTLPNIVLTDAKYNVPVWMSFNPSAWISELKADATLKAMWTSEPK